MFAHPLPSPPVLPVPPPSMDFNLAARDTAFFKSPLEWITATNFEVCGKGQLVSRSTPRKGGARLQMRLVRGLKTSPATSWQYVFPVLPALLKILLFDSGHLAVQFPVHLTCSTIY